VSLEGNEPFIDGTPNHRFTQKPIGHCGEECDEVDAHRHNLSNLGNVTKGKPSLQEALNLGLRLNSIEGKTRAMGKINQPPILELTRLRVARDGKVILSGLDWMIFPKQQWVLLGPNGSGKSSLLATLTGYLSLTSGKISLWGEVYGESDWRELRKQVGLVSPTIASMIQPSEVAQDVVAGGELGQINLWKQPSPMVVRRARAILRRLGVADLALRAWGHLSQGERQKVLMARALATKPRLLILDEPCAGLDPVAREDFVMFMNEVIRLYPASTLVLVTHHVEEIGPRFTHGLFLRGGRMQVQGDLRKILNSSELTKLWQRKCVLRRLGQRWSLTVSGRSIRQKAKIS